MIAKRLSMTAALGAMIVAAPLRAQTPLGSEWTYQGQLKQDEVAADGNYDFLFQLYDDPSTGSQVGGDVYIDDWPVSDGMFTVRLDFGAGAFSGNALWLQVAVRPGDSVDPHAVLSPRQPLTAAPYALYALDSPGGADGHWAASGVDIYATNGGNVGVGTSGPLQKLHVAGTSPGLRLQDDGDPASYTDLRDDRASSVAQFEKRVGPGAVPTVEISPVPVDGVSDARIRFFRRTDTIGSKVVLFNRGDDSSAVSALIGVDGYDSWFQADGGNFGIGTSSPAYPLHLAGTAQIMAKIVTPHTAGTWLDIENTSTGGKRWGLVSTGEANGEGPGHLLLRAITDGRTVMILKGTGNVGIGTTAPQARLHVDGEVRLTGATQIGTGGTADATAKLNILGGTETGPGGGGYLVLGPTDSTNVSFDDNEIQARIRGIAAPLLINPAGGSVHLMQSGTGRVGIGTGSPGSEVRLDVVAPADETAISGSGGTCGIGGWGSHAGGYFRDSDGSGEAWLGVTDEDVYPNSTDLGIVARSARAGGGFLNTLYGTWTNVAVDAFSFLGNGEKLFVQNHPYDKDRVITYACLEGDEVGTYTRGSGRLVNGEARIALGETFKWVTNPDIGLTAHLTPREQAVPLAVVSLSTEELVVRGPEGGPADVSFDYIVHGLRVGFEESVVVRQKDMEAYIPSMAAHEERYAEDPELRRFNALERFKTMRTASGETTALDLSRADALRDAVTVYDPAVHQMPHPPRPKTTPVDAFAADPAAVSSAEADSTQTGAVQDTPDRDAEIQELRARIEVLEDLLGQLARTEEGGRR